MSTFHSTLASPSHVLETLGKNYFTIVTTLTVLVVVSQAINYRWKLSVVSYLPGRRTLFDPFGLGLLFRRTGLEDGPYFLWKRRHESYKKYGTDTISLIPLLVGDPSIYTSNLDVVRQITGVWRDNRSTFMKPEWTGRTWQQWGMNVVVAEGEMWKKHRRILGPAFNSPLYEKVWNETVTAYHAMISAEGWTDKKVIELPKVQKATFKLAMLIIGKCGFGFPFDWISPPRDKNGTLTLQEALRITTHDFLLPTFAPEWVMNLPIKRMKIYTEARNQVLNFMKQQIKERREVLLLNQDIEETDFFSMLVRANEEESSKLKLSDNELIGNVYIMLLAGHETTAYALAGALALMAYHSAIQTEVLDHIISVVGSDRDPTNDDYKKLNKVLAVFYETLRLFPGGFLLIREATEDTTLQVPNPPGQEGFTTIAVQKGTQVIGDVIGLQSNPRYFEDPEQFKPQRWYDSNVDSEAFTAFGIGPRMCLGRKVATTEAVAWLTMLLRDYEVVPLLKPSQSNEQWLESVMRMSMRVTLGVNDVPVKLVKRA